MAWCGCSRKGQPCRASSGGGTAGWSVSTSTPYTPWRRRSSKALQPFSKGVYGWVFCAKTWQLRDVENRVEQWTEIAEQTFVFACYARKWFAKGTFEDKRHILMAVGSNLVLQDKILRI